MTTDATTPFPHAVLTPLGNGRPTVTTLRLLKKELSSNAASVHSIGGNGQLGHYALIVGAPAYLLKAGVAFVVPAHPGANPVHVAGASGAAIGETNRRYAADMVLFNTYRTVDALLKQQLIAAVPGMYLTALDDEFLGFTAVTTFEILEHLDQQYGQLNIDQLNYNIDHMNKTWNPTTSIKKLFDQIGQSQRLAHNTEAISDGQALRSALTNVEKSGVLSEAVRDFRKKPEAEKTWTNFKTMFISADIERHRLQTTSNAGYHTAATATTPNVTVPTKHALAITTASSSNGTNFYCWSHGLGYNKDHTSLTCQAPAPGHRTDATQHNMMGGNNYIRRLRGETQLYAAPPTKTKNSAAAATST